MADDFLQCNANISGIEAGQREGIIAVWKLLDFRRKHLVFQTQKFQHEKYLFESDRAAALKEIHLDLQSTFQSKCDSLVSQLDEALNLLQSRKSELAKQSKYIKSLEDKLKNYSENSAIADETTGSELMQQNLSLKNAFQVAQLELQSLVQQKEKDRLFYENRISQLEADVIRLEQERDQWPKKVHPSDQPEFCVQTEKDKMLSVTLSTKEREDSSGSEVGDCTPPSDTPPLDSFDRYDNIVHVIETSSSQFIMAIGTYNKILNNLCKLESTRFFWVQAELLETCNTNIQCLAAVLSVLRNGYVNVGLFTAIQNLTKKWVQLDAKIHLLRAESV